MGFQLFVILFSAVVGVAGGVASRRLPASGKAGLGLGLIPVGGFGMGMVFC